MNLFFLLYGHIRSQIVKFKSRLFKKYQTWLYTKITARCGRGLNINGKIKLTSNTYLGNNVNFNGRIILGFGKVEIGDNFHSGAGCKFITTFHNYEGGRIPYDSTNIIKNISVKENVWLGDDVIVLGGVTIVEGAIIQAGSVVVSDIPPFAIAGGHPAKSFKYRDIEHYNDLKQKKMFH